MRLTGGLHLTDEEKMYLDKDLENKIINFEKDSRIDYARFRYVFRVRSLSKGRKGTSSERESNLIDLCILRS